MKILTGQYAGMTGQLRQFANDWMTADIPGERPNAIVRPNEVKLDEEEIAKVRNATAIRPQHLGTFWDEWEMYDDGTFVHRDQGRLNRLGATGRVVRTR